MQFIPDVSSLAGSALTQADWAVIGVSQVSVDLTALLIKPGLAVLKQLDSLATYLGWSSDTPLILNVSRLILSKQGVFNIRSPFDGHVEQMTQADVLHCILHLQPQGVVLPVGLDTAFRSQLPSTMQVFIPYPEMTRLDQSMHTSVGFWMTADVETDIQQLQARRLQYSNHNCYLMAQGINDVSVLQNADIQWIESNQPAEDGVMGLCYEQQGLTAITSSSQAFVFESLSDTCRCEACQLGLTKAYLHHLYAQTPGLCHRFLIQHNACVFGFCGNRLGVVTNGEQTL